MAAQGIPNSLARDMAWDSGYFGDILSYSRLMALMLAGSVIAQVFNTLGAIPGGNVERTRFIAVMLSGALSGVGGICFAYSISANFSPNIYMGYGYLAIAAMIFGNWNIPFTALVCLFFGLAKSGSSSAPNLTVWLQTAQGLGVRPF